MGKPFNIRTVIERNTKLYVVEKDWENKERERVQV